MFSYFETLLCIISSLFFFTDPATTEIYTLSLHDALPISGCHARVLVQGVPIYRCRQRHGQRLFPYSGVHRQDRKSTRLNSSHTVISYAVFCLKKKKKKKKNKKQNINTYDRLISTSTSHVV